MCIIILDCLDGSLGGSGILCLSKFIIRASEILFSGQSHVCQDRTEVSMVCVMFLISLDFDMLVAIGNEADGYGCLSSRAL